MKTIYIVMLFSALLLLSACGNAVLGRLDVPQDNSNDAAMTQ